MSNTTKIIKNTLRVIPNQGSYAKTWVPKFSFQLTGPIPSGSVVMAEFSQPNGKTKWLDITADIREISENEILQVDASIFEDELAIDKEGKFKFKIKLVSELEGVDEKLVEGVLEVIKEGSASQPTYTAKADWIADIAKITLNVLEDQGSPRLVASAHVPDANPYEVSAYLFYKGKKIKSSETSDDRVDIVQDPHLAYSNSYADVIIEFRSVFGYTNDEYGDRPDLFDLSANPGEYEIKIAKAKKLVSSIKFTVDKKGKIVKTGEIEPHKYKGAWMYVPLKEKTSKNSFYEFVGKSAMLDLDYFYKHRVIKEAPKETDPNQELIDRFTQKVTDYIRWYGDQFAEAVKSKDYESAAQDANTFNSAYLNELTKVMKEAEAKKILKGDLQKLYKEAETLIKNSDIILNKEKEAFDKRREPFLKVLKKDKLEIFNRGLTYYTSKKKELKTPEEMKKAKVWYEQGWQNSGKVNEMWVLRGYHFDDDHVLVDTIEETGLGGVIPTSFFK